MGIISWGGKESAECSEVGSRSRLGPVTSGGVLLVENSDVLGCVTVDIALTGLLSRVVYVSRSLLGKKTYIFSFDHRTDRL